MFSCSSCKLKPICNILSSVNKYTAYADIEIKNCEFRIDTLDNPTTNKVSITDTSSEEAFIKRSINSDKIQELSVKKKKDREEKNKFQESASPKLKTAIVAKPLELNHKCLGCGGNTFEDDCSKCEECGKDVCSCCATFDSTSKILLCPSCWNKA